MLEDFESLDSPAPATLPESEKLALATQKFWLKRYDILLPYAPPETHPEQAAREIWQTIAAQMQRAALPQFSIGGRKPRLALISPLPPARSGIADYSAALAKALQSTTELSLFTPAPTAGTEILSHLPHITRRFDRVISVMGNSLPHHGEIYDHLIRYGGACICHDARLSGFYEQKFGTAHMAALATAETGKPVSDDDVNAWLNDETRRGADFLDPLAAAARPLILHSYQSVAALQARGFGHVRHLPFAIYRDWPPGLYSPTQQRAARARLGITAPDLLIVSFGYISQTKGIEAALLAMAALPQSPNSATLIWVGQSHTDIAFWQRRAAELGVASAVKFLDRFIDEADYRDYLLAADCGLQLRQAGQGNISGALQDCIAAGLPTVANADLAANLNAPAYVTRVSDDLDPVEIATAISAILTQRPHTDFARADYAAARSMSAYAEGLCKLLELG
jgi:glycosyltransferase involved in cell wall biosynthesis